MSEKGDPTIKLFGKTIQLRSNLNGDNSNASGSDVDCECTSSDQNLLCTKQGKNRGDEKASIRNPLDAKQQEEPSSISGLQESKTLASPSTITENSKTLSNDKKSSPPQDHSKEDQSDETCSSHSQDQCPPKKPDKIIPCPRCNSMDTKFCYFNNYNVNQPRHFCKNCQRYWTAGGTMRNVPVGAGRRKNKNSSASQHQQLMIGEKPNGLIHHGLRSDKDTILTFGPNSTLSESMALKLKLANGYIEPETRILSLCGGSNTLSNDNSVCTTENVPDTSLPYTWNPIPLPSGFPASFYSQPLYLACNSPGITSWNLHWLQNPSFCPDHSSTTSSNPKSPSLGKHSRDGTVLRPLNPDNEESMEDSRFFLPKTLRIDDPSEAAKSSIWDTLAIKNDYKVDSSNVVAGFFRGFQQPKDANHDNGDDQSAQGSSMALPANPAAFSRSLSFHDNA